MWLLPFRWHRVLLCHGRSSPGETLTCRLIGLRSTGDRLLRPTRGLEREPLPLGMPSGLGLPSDPSLVWNLGGGGGGGTGALFPSRGGGDRGAARDGGVRGAD